MSTFVIGDIHGAYKALKQCLELSKIDYDKDTLIVLGDVVDGKPDVYECVKELLQIKNLIYIIGNHDFWFYEYIICGIMPSIWTLQGGKNTIRSYQKNGIHESHKKLFCTSPYKYEILDNDYKALFIHGGYDFSKTIEHTTKEDLMWDRFLFEYAFIYHSKNPDTKIGIYDDIFIGHTATITKYPVHVCNVWNLDQGAGWDGHLTIMNVYTKEYWLSDNVLDLGYLMER